MPNLSCLPWRYFCSPQSAGLRMGFLPLVVSGSCSSLQCMGFSLKWLLSLQSMGSRAQPQYL